MNRFAAVLMLALSLAPAPPGGGSAWASGGGGGHGAEKGGGEKGGNINNVRMNLMMAIVNERTKAIENTIPIAIELNADSLEAKDHVLNLMPRLMDAYNFATYGNVFGTTSYERVERLIKSTTEQVVGPEKKDQIHVLVRVGVKP